MRFLNNERKSILDEYIFVWKNDKFVAHLLINVVITILIWMKFTLY